MSDYNDYENNLAFPPQGDWSDTEPKNNTDRTDSTIELVEKIEQLTEENRKLKQLIDFYWGELGEPEYRCTYKKDGCIGEKCDECKYFKVER